MIVVEIIVKQWSRFLIICKIKNTLNVLGYSKDYMSYSSTVVQQRLGAARSIQALIFSIQPHASRIQTLLSNILSNFRSYLTFKLYRLFQRQRFCFKSQKQLTKPTPNLFFSSLIRNLHLDRYCSLKLCITNFSREQESRRFLIYHHFPAAADTSVSSKLKPVCQALALKHWKILRHNINFSKNSVSHFHWYILCLVE